MASNLEGTYNIVSFKYAYEKVDLPGVYAVTFQPATDSVYPVSFKIGNSLRTTMTVKDNTTVEFSPDIISTRMMPAPPVYAVERALHGLLPDLNRMETTGSNIVFSSEEGMLKLERQVTEEQQQTTEE